MNAEGGWGFREAHYPALWQLGFVYHYYWQRPL